MHNYQGNFLQINHKIDDDSLLGVVGYYANFVCSDVVSVETLLGIPALLLFFHTQPSR